MHLSPEDPRTTFLQTCQRPCPTPRSRPLESAISHGHVQAARSLNEQQGCTTHWYRPESRAQRPRDSPVAFLVAQCRVCWPGMIVSVLRIDGHTYEPHRNRVCLGLFLSMIDSSIVATSLYTIAHDFQSFAPANWVALAYTLAYLGCAVTFARVSDVIGRRNAFVAAHVLFLAFSMACGFAQNLSLLITFRALQGVGGSGM